MKNEVKVVLASGFLAMTLIFCAALARAQAPIVQTSHGGMGQNFSSASKGSVPYVSAPGIFSLLPIGTAGQLFEVVSGVPTWATLTGANPISVSGLAISILNCSTTTYGAMEVGTGLSVTSGIVSLPNIGTAGTYGDSSHYPVITTDAQGRVTSVATQSFSSGGTVSSFTSGNLSPIFTTSVSSSSTTPNLAFGLSNANANTVLAGPLSGASGAPTYRTLVTADLPTINETLGTKLRRLAYVAENGGDPWSRPYMKSVPPWQPSTAYIKYQTVVNGGNIYVCATAGTSATSGGPTATANAVIADNTIYWIWWGPNTVTSDPALTQNAWSASTAYTLGTQVINGANVYACVFAGTSAASGGPTGTSNSITDNTAKWTYMGGYKDSSYVNDFPTFTTQTTAPSGMTNSYLVTSGVNLSAQRAFVVSGGTGYAVNDTITLTGGTSTQTTVLKVTGVTSGVIKTVSIQTPGVYTVEPPDPVSQGSTSGTGTGATFTINWPDPAWCRLRGCYNGGAVNTNNIKEYTFQQGGTSAPVALHGAIEFYSDAPKLYFVSQGGIGINVVIDGVRYALNDIPVPSSGTNYNVFDFTSTSGRKKRLWRFEWTGAQNVSSVNVDTQSSCWQPNNQDRVRAVVISDSIIAGYSYGPFIVGNPVTLRLGHLLGWNDVWNFSTIGSGYIAGGGNTFGSRIAEALTLNPDIWVFMGSTNDIGQSGISSAVTSALQAIRSGGSTAPIVVFGVWSINNSGVAATESAVSTGVAAAADPLNKTWFIPIYNDPYLPWITGSWDNQPAPSGMTQTGAGNAAIYVDASDNLHPIDPGSEYLAKKLANAIQNTVLPTLP